ncbi:NADH-quinone oxidoreductase subunit C [Streptomyces sp. CA-294286]|uniref:NADH-quinone oxidoreductase subunit C n=1 Tax=Streptomyces sp. CA-294286 TaxID=3240070 RepID=UPI003D8D7A04
MSAYDGLPDSVTEVFGEEATAGRAYDLLTVDVPAGSWITALETARDMLGCTYFDWLSAVDEPGTGFLVSAHVVSLEGRTVRRLLIRTTVPHSAAALPTATGVYAGAGWHERETHEMFGIAFTDHPHLAPLLLPDTFEGHPLRKDFVLAARVAKAWPGAKEPGESDHGGPKRRQMLPPGVPDPNEWGPLKGQLPAAAARPARGARAAGAGARAEAAADRPARRTRSATGGSASQASPEATSGAPTAPASAAPARRSRGVTEGSASQASPEATSGAPTAPASAAPARRSRSASQGSASQAAVPESGTRTSPESGTQAPRKSGPAASEPSATDPSPTDLNAQAGPSSERARAERAVHGPAAPEPGATEPAAPASGTTGSVAPQTAVPEAAASEPDAAQSAVPESMRRDAAVPESAPAPVRSSDAPWHHARPAFEDPDPARRAAPAPAPVARTGQDADRPTEVDADGTDRLPEPDAGASKRVPEPDAGAPKRVPEPDAGAPKREPDPEPGTVAADGRTRSEPDSSADDGPPEPESESGTADRRNEPGDTPPTPAGGDPA